MAPRYLSFVRALTASVVLGACERRADPFEGPTPLMTPGAVLLDASTGRGATTTVPTTPVAIPTPVAMPTLPGPASGPIFDPEVAFKQSAILSGCPTSVPSGTCGGRIAVYGSECLYDPATTGLASRGSMTCRCSSGSWLCGPRRYRSHTAVGPLAPPESVA